MKKVTLFAIFSLALALVGHAFAVLEPTAELTASTAPTQVAATSALEAPLACNSQNLEASQPFFTPDFLKTSFTLCALDQSCAYGCEMSCGGVTNPCFLACLIPGCCI